MAFYAGVAFSLPQYSTTPNMCKCKRSPHSCTPLDCTGHAKNDVLCTPGVSTCTPYVCCKMRLYQNVTLAQPLGISKVEIQRYFSYAVSVGNNVH